MLTSLRYLDELADSETVRGFAGGYGNVFAHELVSFFHSFRQGESDHSRMALGSRNASIPNVPNLPRDFVKFGR
jgi:hypothetical protein